MGMDAVTTRANEIGHLAVGVPGSVKGYAAALGECGTLPWAVVMAPAIERAHAGFMVRPHVHWYWSQDQSGEGQVNTAAKLAYTETGRKVYFDENGALKKPGDTVFNPDLARTLERLASQGRDCFYTGEIAGEIARDMRAHGGLVTREDLARYDVSWTEPLRASYRGWEIATNPPPASGASLLQLLRLMEQFDVGAMGHGSAEHVPLLAEAMKRMTIDKERYHGDPDFAPVPADKLLSDAYAILDAVCAPRVMAVIDTVEVSNRIRHSVTGGLESEGYEVRRSYQSYAFAALHAIAISADGELSGAADPQRDGMAVAV